MLIAYRRHQKSCEHQHEGRAYRRCRCLIWADGTVGGVEIRKSLRTRDWEKAQDIVRKWEAEGRESKETHEPITIQIAGERCLADAKTRNLNESTMYKYRLLFKQIGDFAQKRGLRFLKELDL